jgi:hypothetical protein
MDGMNEQTFAVGSAAFLAVDSPAGRYSAFFEEADETGYFYAVDLSQSDQSILDAVHIYNVANVTDRNKAQLPPSSGRRTDKNARCSSTITRMPCSISLQSGAIAVPISPIFLSGPNTNGPERTTVGRMMHSHGLGPNVKEREKAYIHADCGNSPNPLARTTISRG